MTDHHRHQTSLEHILDFSSQPSLASDEMIQASSIFNELIRHSEPLQNAEPYQKITLVRLTYEYIRAKDIFLRQFFMYLGSQSDRESLNFSQVLSRFSGFDSDTAGEDEKVNAEDTLRSFADYLFDNFFLPLKASGRKTPQPTPAGLSAPALENVVGTPARLSTLRRDCLIRDHHRCVISHAFDRQAAKDRFKTGRLNARDDEGQPLRQGMQGAYLEVAHIIPHSIMSPTFIGGEPQLSDSKKTALAILNMFDPGVTRLIEGLEIDKPRNAISLAIELHIQFSNFDVYFEPAEPPGTHPLHTYKIDTTESEDYPFRSAIFPVTRTLYLSPNRTIDPPSERLLGIHRACAKILHLSAAGDHIDKILRDMEELCIKSDGSADLGRIVSLKVGGWLGGVAVG